jgi:hypothetical protein
VSLAQCGTCGCTHNRDRIVNAIADLERKLESARRIAVNLEQELDSMTPKACADTENHVETTQPGEPRTYLCAVHCRHWEDPYDWRNEGDT